MTILPGSAAGAAALNIYIYLSLSLSLPVSHYIHVFPPFSLTPPWPHRAAPWELPRRFPTWRLGLAGHGAPQPVKLAMLSDVERQMDGRFTFGWCLRAICWYSIFMDKIWLYYIMIRIYGIDICIYASRNWCIYIYINNYPYESNGSSTFLESVIGVWFGGLSAFSGGVWIHRIYIYIFHICGWGYIYNTISYCGLDIWYV